MKTRVWVAQATGLCRPATRRTERVGRPYATLTGFFDPSSLSFRSASRRPERAGRPHYPLFKQALTAKDTGQRLAKSDEIGFNDKLSLTEEEQAIFVDPSKTFQTVLGIGGALTDASAETFYNTDLHIQQI